VRRVTIKQFKYEPDLKTFVGHVEAVIELDETGVHDLKGEAYYASIPANDVMSGTVVALECEPIRWSELIASTLSYGDIEVEVEEIAAGGDARPLPQTLAGGAAAIRALAAQVHGQ
jgi:hypothetical protein